MMSNKLARYRMEVGSPSMDKPVTVHHYADNDGTWVYFVDAEAEIEALEAKLKKVREELDCVKHYDCASEIGKPCNCDLADVYKALNE
jgi:hypothetical protein